MKLKNTILSILAVCAAMLTFAGGATAGAEAGGTGSLMAMMPFLIILVVMYVMMIVPENKRKKKAQQMRDSIEVGDKIVTIGGIIGKVVHVSSDRITFETGEDRVRMEVNKWAVSTNEGKGANKETEDSQETLGNCITASPGEYRLMYLVRGCFFVFKGIRRRRDRVDCVEGGKYNDCSMPVAVIPAGPAGIYRQDIRGRRRHRCLCDHGSMRAPHTADVCASPGRGRPPFDPAGGRYRFSSAFVDQGGDRRRAHGSRGLIAGFCLLSGGLYRGLFDEN